jgi:hypothetical protein
LRDSKGKVTPDLNIDLSSDSTIVLSFLHEIVRADQRYAVALGKVRHQKIFL